MPTESEPFDSPGREPRFGGEPGGRAVFATTHWSVVLAAAGETSPDAAEALAELCRSYWYPLYAYVRRRGYDVAEAQDLTQAFFARFLEKNYLNSVDRRKGRFRSFLLAAMEHFLAKEWTKSHRLKRGGGQTIISWDAQDPEQRYRLEPVDDWDAERLYERRWALILLEQALGQLRAGYVASGRGPIFEQLKGLLSGDNEATYPEVARRLGQTEGAVRVAVHRLRQRYGECVRQEIAKVVERADETEEELRHLFAALG